MPVAYLIGIRLNHAAQHLQEQDYSVCALCEACGFRDEAHFMKKFKKKYGLTVQQYRQKYIDGLSKS